MKNKKVKIAYLLMTFIFLFTYIGGFFLATESYADDNSTYVELLSTNKPKSGSFKNSNKSHSTPKTTIKPDSGGFSTKPKTNNKNPGSSSTIKPDSGNFSTKPKDNSTNNKNYEDYGDNSSKKSIFKGGYYRGYSPYRRGFFGYGGISSWIVKIVMVIAILVVLYIIFDYIRNRKN